MKPFFFFFLFLLPYFPFAQRHNAVWMFGYGGTLEKSKLDFNVEPPEVSLEFFETSFLATNMSYCDNEGDLIMYSNGLNIVDSLHQEIINGDSLNAGEVADDNPGGYTVPQGGFFLPFPENDKKVILFHSRLKKEGALLVSELLYSIIRLDTLPVPMVIGKNKLLLPTPIQSSTAVKHANGRDWWIIVPEKWSKKYTILLIDPNGISIAEEYLATEQDTVNISNAGKVFSPDGNTYACFDNLTAVNIFNFDRCEGKLSGYRSISFDEPLYPGGGLAISPNSRYLYFNSDIHIFQIDLWSNDLESSLDTVATYDGYQSPLASTFYFSQLGPNGKIYLVCSNLETVLHVIHKPDLPGESCEVEQHGIQLPNTNGLSIPHFPNYRLGALDGSPCDTLGVVSIDRLPTKDSTVFKIFPNPSSSDITVQVRSEEFSSAGYGELQIFDSNGILVSHTMLNKRLFNVNVSHLPTGVYWCRFVAGACQSKYEKLVIVR
jgi:hypothetical protein